MFRDKNHCHHPGGGHYGTDCLYRLGDTAFPYHVEHLCLPLSGLWTDGAAGMRIGTVVVCQVTP